MELPSDIIGMEEVDDVLNILVYGPSGVGKTVLSAGAGLILATESGLTSARRTGSKAKVWPLPGWEDMRRAYQWIKKNHAKPDFPFKWIAVDSLEELQAMALRWILDKNVEEDEGRDPDLPSQGDHQKWQNMFKRMVKEMNAIPVDTIYTATVMQGETEKGDVLILPSFLGKGIGISSFVCAQMHAVGYMHLANVKVPKKDGEPGEMVSVERRRIQWQAQPKVYAKDRSTMMGKYTDNLTLARISTRMKSMPEPKAVVRKSRPGAPATPGKAATSATGPATAAPKAVKPAPAKGEGATGDMRDEADKVEMVSIEPAPKTDKVEDINLDAEQE